MSNFYSISVDVNKDAITAYVQKELEDFLDERLVSYTQDCVCEIALDVLNKTFPVEEVKAAIRAKIGSAASVQDILHTLGVPKRTRHAYRSIETLHVPTYVKHTLVSGGITDVEQLTGMTRRELLRISGIGVMSVAAIEAALTAVGEHLRGTRNG